MAENGADKLNALTRIDDLPRSLLAHDPQVALATTADSAALMSDWMGFVELVREDRGVLSELPKPRGSETAPDYIRRVWPLLEPEERGIALELGLQQMVTLERVAQVGIQVRIWRAYETGDWIHSPECPDSFRGWVKHVLADTLDGSLAEASHLANVVEAVAFLRDNPQLGGWLPEDLETCFRRPGYRRWRAVAAKILERKRALDDVPEEEAGPILEEIEQLSAAAADEGLTTQDLDAIGRKKPTLPTIIARVQKGKDPITGQETVILQVSPAQKTLLEQKTRGILSMVLEGETYKVPEYRYTQYCLDRSDQWMRRTLHDGRWGDWQAHGGQPVGAFDTVAFTDEDRNLTVLNYWVEVVA